MKELNGNNQEVPTDQAFQRFLHTTPDVYSFVPNLLCYLYHTFLKGILWVFSYNLIDNILKSNGIQPLVLKNQNIYSIRLQFI